VLLLKCFGGAAGEMHSISLGAYSKEYAPTFNHNEILNKFKISLWLKAAAPPTKHYKHIKITLLKKEKQIKQILFVSPFTYAKYTTCLYIIQNNLLPDYSYLKSIFQTTLHL